MALKELVAFVFKILIPWLVLFNGFFFFLDYQFGSKNVMQEPRTYGSSKQNENYPILI